MLIFVNQVQCVVTQECQYDIGVSCIDTLLEFVSSHWTHTETTNSTISSMRNDHRKIIKIGKSAKVAFTQLTNSAAGHWVIAIVLVQSNLKQHVQCTCPTVRLQWLLSASGCVSHQHYSLDPTESMVF